MSQYIEFLKEVFYEFGDLSVRKMFGGYGIYHQGVMFALVADEALYLKVDASIKHYFDELDLPAFEYDKNGKTVSMSYCLAPEAIYDDPEEAALWANRSYKVALSAKLKK